MGFESALRPAACCARLPWASSCCMLYSPALGILLLHVYYPVRDARVNASFASTCQLITRARLRRTPTTASPSARGPPLPCRTRWRTLGGAGCWATGRGTTALPWTAAHRTCWAASRVALLEGPRKRVPARPTGRLRERARGRRRRRRGGRGLARGRAWWWGTAGASSPPPVCGRRARQR